LSRRLNRVTDAIKCPSCGEEIEIGTDSCPECDQPLCPQCGAAVSEDDPACPACGHEFTFTCPDCEAEVGVEDMICPNCGLEFFGEPEALVVEIPPELAETEEVKETEKTWHCPRCEIELPGGVDLCPSCGQELCPKCGAAVDGQWLDCQACGYKFTFTCPDCGGEVEPEDMSCPNCGLEFVLVVECPKCGLEILEEDVEVCPDCGYDLMSLVEE
jgi:RNA polymerase subunit RPABC4/transcription elongation factor Spt4